MLTLTYCRALCSGFCHQRWVYLHTVFLLLSAKVIQNHPTGIFRRVLFGYAVPKMPKNGVISLSLQKYVVTNQLLLSLLLSSLSLPPFFSSLFFSSSQPPAPVDKADIVLLARGGLVIRAVCPVCHHSLWLSANQSSIALVTLFLTS